MAVNAMASDNVGVSKVEFYDGTTLLGIDATSPYSYSWAIAAANMGLDLAGALDRFNAHSRCKLRLDVGLDTGAAMGVTVGRRRARK